MFLHVDVLVKDVLVIIFLPSYLQNTKPMMSVSAMLIPRILVMIYTQNSAIQRRMPRAEFVAVPFPNERHAACSAYPQ